MYIDIDYTKRVIKPRLFLAKPNKTSIAILSEAFNIKQKIHLGEINELSFDLPVEIDDKQVLKRNEHVDLIKKRYLIKFVKGSYIEWYIVESISKHMEEDREYYSYHCFSLAYELTDKFIKNYSVVSKNATQLLTDALASTTWTIDYMDASFDTKFRSFDVSTKSVLEFIFDVAAEFNALIMWDTSNRKISFYKLENVGQNKGLKIKYGKLLKSITVEEEDNDFCTRLKIEGRDGISINSVNPTGTNYIEDYSYFIYPFARDESRNVLTHSDYMSDDLCHALLDYFELVESKKGEFATLLSELSSLQAILTTKENELDTLEGELEIIETNLSIANATGGDVATIIASKNAKLSQIMSKKSEIEIAKTNITNKQSEINDLKDLLAIENNFTNEQLEEWNYYIIEKEWANTNIDDPEQLLEYATEEFEKLRNPRIVAEIDIVNLLEIVEEQKNWDRFNIGDIVTIVHERLNINIQAKMIEFNFDYEDGSIKVTISNVKDILNDQERFIKDIQKSISTSTTFNQNRLKYESAKETADEVSQILNETWDAVKRSIVASNNETVQIDSKGIRTYDLNDPMKVSIMQHGIIAVSSDGGNTWRNAITYQGVIGERIVGQIIAGNNLLITNSGGTFSVNATGVVIDGTSLTITGGLPPEQLDPAFKDSLVELDRDYSNGIRIDSSSGVVVLRSDSKVRTVLNATDGIKIEKNTGTAQAPVWTKNFYVNTNGDLQLNNIDASGTIRATQLILNGVNVLTSSGNLIKGQYIDQITTDQLVAGSAKISTAMIENLVVGTNVTMGPNATISWSQVTNKPTIPTLPSYIQSTKITSTTIESPTITAGTLIGADIIGTSTITGALIRTSSSGNRIEISGTGLETLNSSGQRHGIVLGGGNFSGVDFYYNNTKRGELSQAANNISVSATDGTTTGGGTQLILESRYSNVIIRPGTGNGASYGSVLFYGTVNFSNANVQGLNVTAKFA